MKRCIPFMILALALGFTSCEKKTEVVSGQDLPKEATEKENSSSDTVAYILRADTGFYEITDGEAKWKVSIALGDKVAFLNEKVKALYEKNEYEFAKIRRDDGKEGFVLATQIATNGELAVITGEKRNVYKTAKNVDVTSFILPLRTIVVVFPSTTKDNFIAFSAYDPLRKIYVKENFIKVTEYSSRVEDVQSAILLQTALATKDAVRKKALLDSALLDYPGSVFLNEISSAAGQSSAMTFQAASGTGTINDDNVNLRDLPDAVNGIVSGLLSKGTEVTLIEESVESYMINSQTAKWYHISSPSDGWVFGAFIDK